MRAEAKRYQSGAELSHKSATYIPAGQQLRPLRDQMVVEVLDAKFSNVIEVINECKPVRGRVKAIGPGHYPNVYLDKHGDKLPDHRRSDRKQVAAGTQFVRTSVKVGEIVNLGGLEHDGYAFQTLYWGNKLHLVCREADVAVIENA